MEIPAFPLCTLLELIHCVQSRVNCEDELIWVITYLINQGYVVLAGTFAGHRIPEASAEAGAAEALALAIKAELAKLAELAGQHRPVRNAA